MINPLQVIPLQTISCTDHPYPPPPIHCIETIQVSKSDHRFTFFLFCPFFFRPKLNLGVFLSKSHHSQIPLSSNQSGYLFVFTCPVLPPMGQIELCDIFARRPKTLDAGDRHAAPMCALAQHDLHVACLF